MPQPCHVPVLVQQVVELFTPCATGLLVDATVGLGGHAEALLSAFPQMHLVGLDVDGQALELARQRLAPFARRAELIQASYQQLAEVLGPRGGKAAGVLFDLGVSSLQLDTPERGFSFRLAGPLDMRFAQQGPTLADILASATEAQLTFWLATWGEEKRASAIARAILRARDEGRLCSTTDLRRAVWSVTGPKRGPIDPATRTFQALRMVTNRELVDLPAALETAVKALQPAGRVVVLAYHSLEDRVVKTTLRRLSGACVCPPGSLSCTCTPMPLVKLLTRKPVTPSPEEVHANPRARSAKLRAAERL
ncbi:MAG: 16S rRNA (cytosine(1402)-N(4))-methyltransferase RsmH [Thermoanaerobaculum sp.]|nr:16S rRNA (cytosine(1402)-N(4))-methyltransferase RsmH [Thermoanaerobaculum sp.]MDW7968249.1 16S rRNA (cytosine(1402)-N(4))-methyltransferase RsmH [Thermoanaerobaculum sp.]